MHTVHSAAPRRQPQTATPRPTAPPRPPSEPVLVVSYSDGWLEAYADRHVDVTIVEMPAGMTVAAEIAVEEYIERLLPHRLRSLYYPTGRRAAAMLRPVTASSILARDHDVAMLRAIERAGAMLRGNSRQGGVA